MNYSLSPALFGVFRKAPLTQDKGGRSLLPLQKAPYRLWKKLNNIIQVQGSDTTMLGFDLQPVTKTASCYFIYLTSF